MLLEDEIDSVSVVLHHAAQMREHIVLLAHTLFGPFHGQLVIAGIRFHPVPVHFGASAQDGLIDHRNAGDIAEKVDHLLGPHKPLKYPLMTIRSKQCYTKTSRLPNSFVNVSIESSSWIESR